jgi:AraC-like DNA-binding protein
VFGKYYSPHPALQDIVFAIIAIDEHLPGGISHVITPYPPTPLQSIMFYFDHPILMQKEGSNLFERQSPVVVVGPQYSRVNLKVIEKLTSVRVDFKPGGLFRLLGVPMNQLFDQGIPAEQLFGNEMVHLNERLLNAGSMDVAVKAIELFLLKRCTWLKPSLPFDVAMNELMFANGNLSIENTASIACMSVRQLERKCIERVGMTPKTFARIIRFSKAYRLRESRPELAWSAIAGEAGYFDQMHMIKDFKKFTGSTPTILEDALSMTPLRMQADIL